MKDIIRKISRFLGWRPSKTLEELIQSPDPRDLLSVHKMLRETRETSQEEDSLKENIEKIVLMQIDGLAAAGNLWTSRLLAFGRI